MRSFIVVECERRASDVVVTVVQQGDCQLGIGSYFRASQVREVITPAEHKAVVACTKGLDRRINVGRLRARDGDPVMYCCQTM